MEDKVDYSLYECPYAHLEKDCGHELKGPEGYEKTYGVWCSCGFRGPVFYLDPDDLKLKMKDTTCDCPNYGDNNHLTSCPILGKTNEREGEG